MLLRELSREIFLSTLRRIDVPTVMERRLRVEDGLVRTAGVALELKAFRRVKVVSTGKAAAPMAETLMRLLRPQLLPGQRLDGVVVGPRAAEDPQLCSFLGGHPLPNEQSLLAAAAVLQYLSRPDECDRQTLVFFLISGGSSAMLEQALDASMTLADIVEFHRGLVHSGLNIEMMNILRKHFSCVKGGRLAVAAGAATKCTLLVSDVPGKSLDIVGSGPTLPDPSTVTDCRELLARHGEAISLSRKVRNFFEGDSVPETPKGEDAAFQRAFTGALLSSDDLWIEATRLAQSAGFFVVVDNTCDEWPCADTADYLLQRIAELSLLHPRVCLLSAGEISLKIQGAYGVGGRNQHFVLECARRIAQSGLAVTVLSAGSDGVDGNSAAAGGIVDETTLSRAATARISVAEALAAFDSHRVLKALGDTVETGPSGNNVRDLRILFVDRA